MALATRVGFRQAHFAAARANTRGQGQLLVARHAIGATGREVCRRRHRPSNSGWRSNAAVPNPALFPRVPLPSPGSNLFGPYPGRRAAGLRALEAAGPRRRGPRVRPPRGGPRRPLVNLTTQNSRPSSVVGPAAPLAARARKSGRSNRTFRYYGADRQVCSQYQERLSRIATVKHPKLIQIFHLIKLRRIPPARCRAPSGPKASPCSH